jgi:hypothetical protein
MTDELPAPFDPTVATAPPIANDSAEIGYLQPLPWSPAVPPYTGTGAGGGQSLDLFMQQIVAGVSGLEPDLVRPRWQPEPPNEPPIGTTWCAVGVMESRPQGFPWAEELSTPNGLGSSQRADWEEFDVLCSFYGPNADQASIYLREGMFVAQNQEPLIAAQVAFVDTGPRLRVPQLKQARFQQQIDIKLTFRRVIQTVYPVLYFLSEEVQITTDVGYETENSFDLP